MGAWSVNDETKTWDSVFDCAWAGEPRFVTRNGTQTVVIITLRDYKRASENHMPDFMRFAGSLSSEDAKEMNDFVNHADFSKVDEGMWK